MTLQHNTSSQLSVSSSLQILPRFRMASLLFFSFHRETMCPTMYNSGGHTRNLSRSHSQLPILLHLLLHQLRHSVAKKTDRTDESCSLGATSRHSAGILLHESSSFLCGLRCPQASFRALQQPNHLRRRQLCGARAFTLSS